MKLVDISSRMPDHLEPELCAWMRCLDFIPSEMDSFWEDLKKEMIASICDNFLEITLCPVESRVQSH